MHAKTLFSALVAPTVRAVAEAIADSGTSEAGKVIPLLPQITKEAAENLAENLPVRNKFNFAPTNLLSSLQNFDEGLNKPEWSFENGMRRIGVVLANATKKGFSKYL